MVFDSYTMLEMLSRYSSSREILWIFSRFKGEKRLTLLQNPHFYIGLPTLAQSYGSGFRVDPIDSFHHDHGKVSVLTDNPSRVYLENAQRRRALSNAWLLGDVIIFKGLSLCVISLSRPLTRTSSQTCVESSRVKISSERSLRAHPTYGTERNLCHWPACRLP